LDFAGAVPDMDFDLVVNLESWANGEARPRRSLRLDARVAERRLVEWKVDGCEESSPNASSKADENAKLALVRNFEFRLPLTWLLATPGTSVTSGSSGSAAVPSTSKLRLRFSLWQNRLPVDALPVEGWIELQLVSEVELGAGM
jgi:hypothetical protein